jgi:predicted naringenin-chalcone synthase
MILFVGTIGILIPGVQPVVLAALLISPENTRGALWLGAGCLCACFAIATGLRVATRPRAA